MAMIGEQGIIYELPLRKEHPSQNWSGQGESDCLIKTKHCDGVKKW